jgi:NAD(P)-dependent dehydrogenase (short-subunit alcohol dehydrogenase family)
MRLANKFALITGDGAGIGHAIGRGFAREGASVALADFDLADAEEGVKQIRALGAHCLAVQSDLTKGEAVKRMVEKVVEQFGRIDILVNASGYSANGLFFERTEDDWDRAIAISLKSTFLCCQSVGRIMAQQKSGKIINITSVVGKVGQARAVIWSAARGGVDAMTRSLAMALAPYGIRVNALARGALETTPYPPEEMERRLRNLPFQRLGTVEDLVGPALFLASEESDWITGDILYADGGRTQGNPRHVKLEGA